MKNKNNGKKSVFHLILLAFLGGIVGLTASMLFRNVDFESLILFLQNTIYKYSVAGVYILGLSSIIISLVLFHVGKKKVTKSLENEDEILDDKLLDFALIVCDMGNVLVLLTLLISLRVFNLDHAISAFIRSSTVVWLLIILSVIQNRIIEFYKSYNPEKRGDVYKLNFNKEWLESSDEREQMEIYRAGYNGFMHIQYAILALAVIIGVLSIEVNIGVLPMLTLGTIYLVGKISYSLMVLKYKK